MSLHQRARSSAEDAGGSADSAWRLDRCLVALSANDVNGVIRGLSKVYGKRPEELDGKDICLVSEIWQEAHDGATGYEEARKVLSQLAKSEGACLLALRCIPREWSSHTTGFNTILARAETIVDNALMSIPEGLRGVALGVLLTFREGTLHRDAFATLIANKCGFPQGPARTRLFADARAWAKTQWATLQSWLSQSALPPEGPLGLPALIRRPLAFPSQNDFTVTVREAMVSVTKAAAAAISAMHAALCAVAPPTSTATLWLQAVAAREGGDPTASSIVAQAREASKPWLPIREALAAGAGRQRYTFPRIEYEAVCALAACGYAMKPDDRLLFEAAQAAVSGYSSQYPARWECPPTVDESGHEGRRSLDQDLSLYDLTFLLGGLKYYILEALKCKLWAIGNVFPPLPEGLHTLTQRPASHAGCDPSAGTYKDVLQAVERVRVERNAFCHPWGSEIRSTLSRPDALRFCMRCAELVHLYGQLSEEWIQKHNAAISGFEILLPPRGLCNTLYSSCKVATDDLVSTIKRLALDQPGLTADVQASLSTFDMFSRAACLTDTEATPICVLVSPEFAEPPGSLARVPWTAVVDFSTGNSGSAVGGTLWPAFRAAISARRSSVVLREALVVRALEAMDSNVCNSLFEPAPATAGVVWVQPCRASSPEGQPNLTFDAYGMPSSPDAIHKVMIQLLALANQILEKTRISKRELFVCVLAYEEYAHLASDPKDAGRLAYVRSDSTIDFAYPRLAGAFLQRLLQSSDVRTSVGILTDSADLALNGNRDPWICSWNEKYASHAVDVLLLPAHILELKLDLVPRQSGLGTTGSGTVQVYRGSNKVPFVRAAARTYAGSDDIGVTAWDNSWAESNSQREILFRAGLELLYTDLPADSLKELSTNSLLAPLLTAASSAWQHADSAGTPEGALSAMQFATGLSPSWGIIDGFGKQACGRQVMIRRDAFLSALEEVVSRRWRETDERRPVFTVFIDHKARTGGSTALRQFAWHIAFCKWGMGVLRVRAEAATTSPAALEAAVGVARLLAQITIDGAVFMTEELPLVIIADRDVPDATLNPIISSFTSAKLRLLIVRTRLVTELSNQPMASSTSSTISLEAPVRAELAKAVSCLEDLVAHLLPNTTLQNIRDRVSKAWGPEDGRFRRVLGMLAFAGQSDNQEWASKAAEHIVLNWVEASLGRLYEEASRDSRRLPALHALVYIAMVQICCPTCPGIDRASLAGLLSDPGERRWLLEAAAEAEDVVMRAAQSEVLTVCRRENQASAALLPFFPDAILPDPVNTASSDCIFDHIVNLHGSIGRVWDAVRNASTLQLRSSAAEAVSGRASTFRDLLRAPAKSGVSAAEGEDIWLEMLRHNKDDSLMFVHEELARRFLATALRMDAAHCRLQMSPGVSTASIAASRSGEIGDPAAVYAAIVCLLRSILRDASTTVLLKAKCQDDVESGDPIAKHLSWLALHVFKRNDGGRKKDKGVPWRQTFSPLIATLLPGEEGLLENPFKSRSMRALAAASAVYHGRWHLSSDFARLAFTFIERINSDGTNDAARPDKSFDPIATVAALHAMANARLQLALKEIDKAAYKRRAGTFNMLGNGQRYLATALSRLASQHMVSVLTTTPEDPRRSIAWSIFKKEVGGLLVIGNRARRWYTASFRVRPTCNPLADEAELWTMSILGGIRRMLELVEASGVLLSSLDELRRDAQLCEYTKQMVSRDEDAAASITVGKERRPLVLDLQGAFDAAYEELHRLHAAIRDHLDDNEEEEVNMVRHESINRNLTLWLCDTDPTSAFTKLRMRVERMSAGDPLLRYASTDAARMAAQMWAGGPEVSTKQRQLNLRNSGESVRFVLQNCLLPHVDHLISLPALMSLLVELAAFVPTSTFRVRSYVKEWYNRSITASPETRSAAAHLYLMMLFCQLWSSHADHSGGDDRESLLKWFKEVNSQARAGDDYSASDATARALHAFRLVEPYNSVEDMCPVRQRFSPLDEAWAELRKTSTKRALLAPKLVDGTVIELHSDANYIEGILKLNGCGAELPFSIQKYAQLRDARMLPRLKEPATAYVDFVSHGQRKKRGVVAVHVQASTRERSRVLLADYTVEPNERGSRHPARGPGGGGSSTSSTPPKLVNQSENVANTLRGVKIKVSPQMKAEASLGVPSVIGPISVGSGQTKIVSGGSHPVREPFPRAPANRQAFGSPQGAAAVAESTHALRSSRASPAGAMSQMTRSTVVGSPAYPKPSSAKTLLQQLVEDGRKSGAWSPFDVCRHGEIGEEVPTIDFPVVPLAFDVYDGHTPPQKLVKEFCIRLQSRLYGTCNGRTCYFSSHKPSKKAHLALVSVAAPSSGGPIQLNIPPLAQDSGYPPPHIMWFPKTDGVINAWFDRHSGRWTRKDAADSGQDSFNACHPKPFNLHVLLSMPDYRLVALPDGLLMLGGHTQYGLQVGVARWYKTAINDLAVSKVLYAIRDFARQTLESASKFPLPARNPNPGWLPEPF